MMFFSVIGIGVFALVGLFAVLLFVDYMVREVDGDLSDGIFMFLGITIFLGAIIAGVVL